MNGEQFKAAAEKMSEKDKAKFQAAINSGNIQAMMRVLNKYI